MFECLSSRHLVGPKYEKLEEKIQKILLIALGRFSSIFCCLSINYCTSISILESMDFTFIFCAINCIIIAGKT